MNNCSLASAAAANQPQLQQASAAAAAANHTFYPWMAIAGCECYSQFYSLLIAADFPYVCALRCVHSISLLRFLALSI